MAREMRVGKPDKQTDSQIKPTIGIIGGSGFTKLTSYQSYAKRRSSTPYGDPSSSLFYGRLSGVDVVFLPRHGLDHTIPPHRVNYRANLWALYEAGVRKVLAIAAVGGIQKEYAPGTVAIPDQILDYTHGREHSYFDDGQPVGHVEFSYPYCEELRAMLIECARVEGISVNPKGTYAATQGPRFETAAEIHRLEQDGANLVGMTGMPEASLACEKGMCYATIALVVNYAAGRGDSVITEADIGIAFNQGKTTINAILNGVVPMIDTLEFDGRSVIRP